MSEAFRILAEGVGPDGFQMADERESLLWGFVNTFDAQVRRLDRSVDRLIAGNELPVTDYEKALRTLAAENRLARRSLAEALDALRSSTNARGRPRIKCVVTGQMSGTGYCFSSAPFRRAEITMSIA